MTGSLFISFGKASQETPLPPAILFRRQVSPHVLQLPPVQVSVEIESTVLHKYKVSLSFWTISKIPFTGYPFSCNFLICFLILGMENSILKSSPIPCFIYLAEYWWNANVVVDGTYGIWNFIAMSFPQYATESDTIKSGLHKKSIVFATVLSLQSKYAMKTMDYI